jgi:hypothetical protein
LKPLRDRRSVQRRAPVHGSVVDSPTHPSPLPQEIADNRNRMLDRQREFSGERGQGRNIKNDASDHDPHKSRQTARMRLGRRAGAVSPHRSGWPRDSALQLTAQAAHFPEAIDGGGYPLHREIDILLRIEPAQTESETPPHEVVA